MNDDKAKQMEEDSKSLNRAGASWDQFQATPQKRSKKSSESGLGPRRYLSLSKDLDELLSARLNVFSGSRDELIETLIKQAILLNPEALRERIEEVCQNLRVEVKSAQGDMLEKLSYVSEIIPRLNEGTHKAFDSFVHAVNETSGLTKRHEAWLLKHHQNLEETYTSTEKAAQVMKESADDWENSREILKKLETELEGFYQREKEISKRAFLLLTHEVQKELLATKSQVEKLNEVVAPFLKTQDEILTGLRDQTQKYKKILSLTPTVAVSFVGVACVLAVVTSLYFVPTFERFSEKEFLETRIYPVVREEMTKSFSLIRAENDQLMKAFIDLERDRFDKFAEHYRKQIGSLKADRLALLEKSEALSKEYNLTVETLQKWKEHSKNLESENASLKKNLSKGSFCGVVAGGSDSSSSSAVLLFVPLFLGMYFLVRRTLKWRS
jgi:hypothetical protein